MPKTRIIILFGGRSVEHEVSLLSARTVYLAIDRVRFDPVLVGIDRHGCWRTEPEQTLLGALGDPLRLRLAAVGDELTIRARPARGGELPSGTGMDSFLRPDDVVFPLLHGTYGEDGTVQGLLELADVAYVGAGHLGSAIAMDKDVSKRLLVQAGLPVVPWRVVTVHQMRDDREGCLARAGGFGFPAFVKPANSGSSVGVSRVVHAEGMEAALHTALALDRKALVEPAIDARELECAILGNDEAMASIPGEILLRHRDGFYSYAAKYVDADGATTRIPAEIPMETSARIRALALEAFRVLELAGMARVDFFLGRTDGRLYINEVNTIPGFTAISLYPQMWRTLGMPITELVTRLIDLAIARRRERRAQRTAI